MTKKITDNLFYLFIFLLPWQTILILREPIIGGEKWQYGTIGIYLTDIILLAWLLLMLYEKFFVCKQVNKFQNLKSKFQIKSKVQSSKQVQNSLATPDLAKLDKFPITNSQLLITGCLVIWLFISILWSPDKMLAFYFSIKLLLAVGLFFTLQNVKINWRKIIFVFLTAAVLQSALAIGQFAFQENFSNKWLGMNNYETWRGGVSVLENEGGRWLRAYGSLPHPNILGGYLTLALIIGLMAWSMGISQNAKCKISTGDELASGYKNLSRRLFKFFKSPLTPLFQRGRLNLLPLEKGELKRDLKPKNNFTKFLILASLLIILLGILLTFSRGAWLALAIGIIFLGVGMWSRTVRSKKEQSTGKNFIKLLLVLSLAGIIFISLNHENFSTRFNAEKRLEQKSISERSLYFNQAKEIIGENFWLGTGAGNYTLAVFQKDEIKRPIWQYQPAHNVFILIWAELGIIGLILFLIVLTQLFLISLKNRTLLCCMLYVISCMLFIDHWLWTAHFGILLFWLVAGLAAKPHNK